MSDTPLTADEFADLVRQATRQGAVQGLREAAATLTEMADRLAASPSPSPNPSEET